MDANEALENARYASELDENEIYETVRTLANEVLRLRATGQRIERALALHRPDHENDCEECYQDYPCPTVQALEGEA